MNSRSLQPGTTYHFRVVASDSNGIATSSQQTFVFLGALPSQGACPNQTLREENNSTLLPDCRAYELVTPVNKNGALIGALFAKQIAPQIAADGERLLAPSVQCFADSPSCVGTRAAEGEPFQFERTPSGWATQSLALPASVYEASSAWGFSVESGAALFSSPSPPNGQDDFYVRAAGGKVSNLGPVWGPGLGSGLSLNVLGLILSTHDFSHVLYSVMTPVWPFSVGEAGPSLYEYPPGVEGSSSEPLLVAVSGGEGSHDLIGACGSQSAGESPASQDDSLSTDGRTTYFQVNTCAHGSGANATRGVPVPELFVRIDGEGPAARTVAISEPAGLSPAQANPACRPLPRR